MEEEADSVALNPKPQTPIFPLRRMEEEADSVTAQVLEEIGLDMMGKMINAPTRAGAAQVKQGLGVWGLGFGV
jgi:hypothetical protein